MAKKESRNKMRVKESSHRTKLKKERENRLRSKQKQSQKKKLNSDLFDLVKKENIDALDKIQKLKVIEELFKLIISFPEENHDKIDLLLEFLQDKNLKIIMKTMKVVRNLFCDLLPSYKIKIDQETNSNNKKKNIDGKKSLSKEVQSIQSYEKCLLKYYEKFLGILSIFLKTFSSSNKSSSKPAISKFLVFTMETVTSLFNKFYLFNLNDILYKIIIEKLTDSNEEIRKKCFESLMNILSLKDNSSSTLELKYEVIKLISHFVFVKPHEKFDKNVLDLFTFHKIEFPDLKKEKDEMNKLADIKFGKSEKIEMESDFKTKKQMQIAKKEKKMLMREKEKIIKNLKKEMNEYDNYSSQKAIFHINLKILKKILLVFFDILKFKKDSPLIRTVLNGIGVLCENINVEILLDLQKCIYEYITYCLNQTQDTENKIYCVTALKSCLNITEKLTKEIISIEDSNLLNTTYLFICKLVQDSFLQYMTREDFFTLLEILDICLLKYRLYSLDTVSAYLKRLAMLSSKLKEKYVPAFLLLIKRILQKYPAMKNMRENDEDFFDYGITIDPSICNGKQSNIYKELELISKNYKNSLAIKKIIDYIRKDDKNNPQLATMSYFDLLLSSNNL
jgi:hypothetical protein